MEHHHHQHNNQQQIQSSNRKLLLNNNQQQQRYSSSASSSSTTSSPPLSSTKTNHHHHHRQQHQQHYRHYQHNTNNSNKSNKYELENSVSELFRLFSVTEAKNFNRETIAERFEKNINRQSSKPFSIFYNRLSDNEKFVEQYNRIKCQNSKEVDPFVRFMVRIREDKNMNNFMNNYNDIIINNNNKQNKHQQQQIYSTITATTIKNPMISRRTNLSSATSPRIQRPSSATSALLNLVNQNDFNATNYQNNKNNNNNQKQQSIDKTNLNNLVKSKTISAMKLASKMENSPSQQQQQTKKLLNPSLIASPILNSIDANDSSQNDISFQSQTPTTTATTTTKKSNHHQHHNQIRKVPPYLSRDFHPCDWSKEDDCFNTLGTYPIQEQEQLLLRDLLFVLIGIEGRFIRLSQSQESCHYKLILDPTTDHFFAVTTQRILKICYHYSTIISFVESRVYGLINQALVASIQQHLYDYNMTICQMEDLLMKNDLFLQKMFFILLPYFSTFSLLKEICSKLYKNRSVGGSVLTLLHEKTKSIQGMDNNALELCLTLTKSSSIPYFDILKTWIYYGEIGDPRKEFFIEDTHCSNNNIDFINNNNNNLDNDKHQHNNTINNKNNNNSNSNLLDSDDDEYDDDFSKFNDKYWDVRYRINSSKTPCFLRKYEQIIYKTGKYVSIINKVKQLFLKSSKVIPIPQSIFQQQQQHQQNSASTTIGSGSNSNNSLLQNISDPLSSYLNSKNYLMNTAIGNNSFMFMNNLNHYHHHQQQQQQQNNPLINDNTSFAYSMASSSSSNNSNHSYGNGTNAGSNNDCASTVHNQQSQQQQNYNTAAIFTPKPEEIFYSFDESTYLTPIQSAYEEASSQLLHILVHESQLVETFNAVKHYMLLSMGDFIVHFLKFASNDLCKRTDSVVQHRLDSMMGMALGISVCHSDRQYLKDDPHVEFVGKSFLKQIYQIMKPFSNQNDNNNSINISILNDPSPSSSYLLRCDNDDDDDDNNDGDVGLNRSIISSVIEDQENDSIDSIVRRPPKYLNNNNNSNSDLLKSTTTPTTMVKKKSSITETIATTPQSSKTNDQQTSSKLFCYESLMLKFDVPFPLSLIFTKKSVVCYELLFRYIFLCRYAEMELEETWKDNVLNIQLKRCDTLSLLNHLTTTTTNNDKQQQQQINHAKLLVKSFKSIHKKAFALRYKMIAFVRNFHYFYAFEVIDPSFIQFISQITKRGSSLDSVIECHEKFLEHCFNSCFLTSLEITTIIIKIFTLCIELSHLLKDSIDVEDQSTMMESSCFFGTSNFNFNNNNQQKLTKSPVKKIIRNLTNEFNSVKNNENENNDNDAENDDDDDDDDDDDKIIHEKLNKIYFSHRIFCNQKSSSSYTIKEIIDKANNEFDTLVSQLLKKIYSDNCEYHMMFPFVARLDYNDFYRFQIMDSDNVDNSIIGSIKKY